MTFEKRQYTTPFENRPNTGTLFENEKKTSETSPDISGFVLVDKALIESLMNKSNDSTIKLSIAGWNKKSSKGNTLISLAVSEPYVAPKQKQPWEQ